MWDKSAIASATFTFLQARSAPVSEYELIQHLNQAGFFAAFEPEPFNLRLFKKHFVTRHCLYDLQQNLEPGWRLDLGLMEIHLHPLESAAAMGQELGQADARLRDFYGDLTHLEQADENSVDELLKQFWGRFYAWQSGAEAYAVLDLQPGAGWDEVELAYRRAAQRAHPDKGGSAEAFARLRRAYEMLKRI